MTAGSAGVEPADWADGCRVGFRPCSYDPKVFSPRVRAELPARHLTAAGVWAGIVPPDGSGEYDVVVFQKAYGKHDLVLAAEVADRGGKVVFDLCDNHFYSPEPRPEHTARVERLNRMIELADVVSVSTPEIAKLVENKLTFVVDDALELPSFGPWTRRYTESARKRRHRHRTAPVSEAPIRLVWQGQHGNRVPRSGLYSITKLVPHLEELQSEVPFRLTVIGNSREAFRSVLGEVRFPVRYVSWRRRTFSAVFAANDISVIPIDVNPFTVCKSANRPVLSLMLGLPVVADRIPSYDELAGFVVLDDWAEGIRTYASDRDLADRHVAEGQRHIRATYTPERVVDQWSQVLRAALRSGATA